MKKTLFAVLLLAAITACTDKSGYTIKGTLTGIENGMAIITNSSRANLIVDTAEIVAGRFTFKGTAETPEFYYLIIDGDKENARLFFLDNGAITITGEAGDLSNMVLTGPEMTMKAEAMEEAQEAFLAALPHHPDSLEKEYYRANTSAERKEEIDVLYDAIEAEKKAPYITYIKENPYSPYSVAILQKSYMGDFSIDELSAMVDSMQQQVTLQGNRLVKEVAATVAIMKATAVGQIAPDFTQNDPDGNPITFSDVYKKNKLTMIDFWASWCGPCRRFNPTLVKLYEKYHRKGFEIMAVSLDQTHEKWVKGIADDKLTWPQVSDLKFWNSEVAKQYNIRLIPQNVFVDAGGKIVAKRVSEDEMDTFIAGQLAK